MPYVVKDKNSPNYFKDASYTSWGFTKSKYQATSYESKSEAQDIADAVNRAVGVTYWDYDDIPPHATVVPL